MGKKTQALCVVAHPDDETIWMGGTILKNKDWDWTILSLCRKEDPDRMPKFQKVCEFYKAKGIISDLEDENIAPIEIPELMQKIISNLPQKEYDYIFTHGENGEYGHQRHKEIHKAVKKLVDSKELNCNKLLTFSYDVPDHEKSEITEPVLESDVVTKLTQKELSVKKEIVNEIYKYPEGGPEMLYCNKIEAFNLA
jgi:LmbE family N-acetylglucosaminyl deacetylase